MAGMPVKVQRPLKIGSPAEPSPVGAAPGADGTKQASSVVAVLPMITAPSAFRRWTTTAPASGTLPLSMGMPLSVGMRAVLAQSLGLMHHETWIKPGPGMDPILKRPDPLKAALGQRHCLQRAIRQSPSQRDGRQVTGADVFLASHGKSPAG